MMPHTAQTGQVSVEELLDELYGLGIETSATELGLPHDKSQSYRPFKIAPDMGLTVFIATESLVDYTDFLRKVSKATQPRSLPDMSTA